MIEFIGWLTLAGGGAYAAFCLCAAAAYAFTKGGLEAAPVMVVAGFAGAITWGGVILWLSPLTIGWGQ